MISAAAVVSGAVTSTGDSASAREQFGAGGCTGDIGAEEELALTWSKRSLNENAAKLLLDILHWLLERNFCDSVMIEQKDICITTEECPLQKSKPGRTTFVHITCDTLNRS